MDRPSAEKSLDPGRVVGLLADGARLRVVAALTLGASTGAELVGLAGLQAAATERALDRLVRAGLVERTEGPVSRYRLRQEVFVELARAEGRSRPRPDAAPADATVEQAEVLRHFVTGGRLSSIPVARAKRLVVLDWLAGRFEPGRVYPERDVNFLLGMVHADYAALRRYLVDEGFMERRDGFYWRAGGTFDLE
jgi:hypothetical protein